MSVARWLVSSVLFVPAMAMATPLGAVSSLASGYTVLDGITRGGVTVYPVVAEGSPKLADDEAMLTLADALRQGVLTVSEAGHDMQVASLRVHNRGKHPVLVMAGEIVEGGQQDRVITQDLLLQPSDRPVTVQVNCVERGRWSGGTQFQYGGQAEMGLRRVVQVRRNQDSTWQAVSEINASKASMVAALGYDASALAPRTSTYLASMRSDVVERQVAKAASELSVEVAKEGDVVGVVVAVGGRIVGSDLYGYPEVFSQVRDATLAAVARDAVTAGVTHSDVLVPDVMVAAEFLTAALDGHSAPSDTRGVVQHASVEVEGARSYALADADGDLLHVATFAVGGPDLHAWR